MTRRILAALLLLLAACGGAAEEPVEALTQRQRDSALAASRLPGAGAIGRALEVSDSMNARTLRLDSLASLHAR
jgi:hypothetical protein